MQTDLLEAKKNAVHANAHQLDLLDDDEVIVDYPLAIAYVEKNLEQHQEFIFQEKASREPRSLVIDRSALLKLKSGASVPPGMTEARIEIEPGYDCDTYSADTKEVLIGLQLVWLSKGSPEGKWTASLSSIAKAIGRSTGGFNLEFVNNHLKVLNRTKIRFVYSFEVKDDDGTHLIKSAELYLVPQLETSNVIYKNSGRVKSGRALLKLDDKVMSNLNSNLVVPINFEVQRSLRGHSKVWYPRVCRILSGLVAHGETNPVYERSMMKLVSDLKVTSSRKKYLSYRESLGKTIVNTLNGTPLTAEGMSIEASLRLNSSGDDWITVFKATGVYKGLRKITNGDRLPVLNTDPNEREAILGLLIDNVGSGNGNSSRRNIENFKVLAKFYSFDLVFKSTSELKDNIQQGVEVKTTNQGFFMGIMKRNVLQAGKAWVFDPVEEKS